MNTHNRLLKIVVLSTMMVLTVYPYQFMEAHAAVDPSRNMSLMLTRLPLLSGSTLDACDPSPNVSTCTGGLATVSLLARQYVASTANNNTIIVIPRLDSLSAVTRMHPDQVGVNLLMYQRMRDQYENNSTGVNLVSYMVDPTSIVNGGTAFSSLLRAQTFKPLSTSMVPPPYSAWKFVADVARIIDLVTMEPLALESVISLPTPTSTTNAKCAVMFDDDSDNLWTTSSFVSPLLYGTRVNATYHKSNPFDVTDVANAFSGSKVVADTVATLRTHVGFIIMISEDNSIPAVDLLADMLALEIEYDFLAEKAANASNKPKKTIVNHLPDVHYQSDIGRQTDPYPVTISATYIASDGRHITKTRSVLIAEMLDDTTSTLSFHFNLTAVQLSVGSSGGVVPSASMILPGSNVKLFDYQATNITKDALYYEDQAAQLLYSRAAVANDPVIGHTLESMPATQPTSDTHTCYAGECGQGTLVARALQSALDVDVSFVASDLPRGSGWPAGNVSFSLAYAVYPWPNLPCSAKIMGLRLWRLIQLSLGSSAFTSASISSGETFLQMYGARVEYSLFNGRGRAVSISVYNRTTLAYEPIDRLRYYTIAATNSECLYHGSITPLLQASALYRGESVQPVYSQEPLQEYISNFLTNNDPYTPILQNYFTAVPATEISSGSRQYLDFAMGLSSCSSTQRYDSGIDTCFDCPAGYAQASSNVAVCDEIPVATNYTPLIAGVASGAALLIAILIVGLIYFEIKRRSNSRSNSNAPKGTGSVAIVFTDIKCSTKLWGAAPASMGVALDTHHSVIRRAIAHHRGYEVKTVGDSFMIAVDDPQRAVDLAVAIQRELLNAEWPTAIDEAYDSDFQDLNILDDPDDVCGPEMDAPWNGLRVRIGVHYGAVEAVLDEVSKGYDYYGPTVNIAARVEGVAEGGQVCITSSVYQATDAAMAGVYTTKFLASTSLRGVRDEVGLYEVKGVGCLEHRAFKNPLIFDEAAKSLLRSSVLVADSTSESIFNQNNPHAVSVSYSAVTSMTAMSEAPMNSNTRFVRNTIREACKAIRGGDRVKVLEIVRRAWRVELPSGGPFAGVVKPKKDPKSKSSSRRRSTALHGHSELADSTNPVDEDDEDIIFRVVAQRVAPGLSRARQHSGVETNYGGDIESRLGNTNFLRGSSVGNLQRSGSSSSQSDVWGGDKSPDHVARSQSGSHVEGANPSTNGTQQSSPGDIGNHDNESSSSFVNLIQIVDLQTSRKSNV